jgi:limonene-1,2-epoxide hydrolase
LQRLTCHQNYGGLRKEFDLRLANALRERTDQTLRETLRRGAERMTALPWAIRHIVAEGSVVMTERVDNFVVGQRPVSVPCMGIFELKDGKIAAWRDYWDLKQFEAQVASPPTERSLV